MKKLASYKKRPIEFIELIRTSNWNIKFYGITVNSELLPVNLINFAKQFLLTELPHPAISNQRYGVGFIIIHQGSLRNWFLLDWWEDEDILHHLLFSSPLDEPNNITAEPDKSLIACVHELRVINFESEAWIKYVLGESFESGIDEYLKQTMNEK